MGDGTTVLTMGTFDTFHVGHLELLRGCRALAGDGGRVVVAVNPDDFVERYKGHAPVVPLAERVEMLDACRFVDAVLVNYGEDSRPMIEAVRPDIVAIGSDWRERDYLGQLNVTQAWLDGRGTRIVYLQRTRGVSTSSIRERARAAA